ncbi:enoyl-CoA hydratase/isomerase family protein [Acidiferrimicrobium sp. IK]|uniref:enoyl-CoA hydratase-related protein n=1 Tax=Acidiferrimicrobium sp. IK TaxID=2871700 RepID=UPI0021CB5384|nr:enoyl-CoA hydratase-related protein [Acidiferrimicrobium sp. IK]MCU4185119.1 enoyl-CoA hydratase/isomerase family protein [Acidiferrimicrobium sp. IK]
MHYQQIDLSVDGPVATLTLDRPDRLNAFTAVMAEELVDAYDRVDADDDIRVVVLTGRGRGFCAGADLGAGAATFAGGSQTGGERVHRDTGGVVTTRMFRCAKPIIAAVNGPAVGVGATMTLPADVRLLSTTARMGFVFGARGIVPDGASAWFLPRVVGISRALEWCLTARVFPPSEALEAGLARSVHEPDDLLPAAYTLAAEMAGAVAPVSAAITRLMLWRMLGAKHPMDAHRVDSVAIAQTGSMADAGEGVTAFLEKRPPQWKLRPSVDMPDWWPGWEEPAY